MARPGLVIGGVVVLLAAAVPGTAASAHLVVTTQNVRHTLTAAHARHDIRHALTGSDLLLTQEMGSRRARAFAPSTYGVAQVSELAIYWRRSTLRYVASFPILLHRSRMFASASRIALAVELRRGSSCLLAVDVHMIPHIEVNGHPRDLPRRRLAALAIARLAAFAHMAARRCALIIGGDWNIDGYADARVRSRIFPAARIGLASDWTAFPRTRPTLGSRNVDGLRWRGLTPISRRILTGTYSDHNGSRSTFR